MKDTDKVTLTIGQLKKLIKESKISNSKILKENTDELELDLPSEWMDPSEVRSEIAKYRRYGVTARFTDGSDWGSYWEISGPERNVARAVFKVYSGGSKDGFLQDVDDMLENGDIDEEIYDILMTAIR